MVFVYLSLGLLLVFLLHLTLKWFTRVDAAAVHRALRWLLIGLVLILVFLLIRFGLLHLAAIVSFISVAMPLLQKFQRNKGSKAEGRAPHRKQPRMTAQEAREILAVQPDTPAKEIQAAHRRMIQKNHPDHGGSEYLASKINEARDVLLDDDEGDTP